MARIPRKEVESKIGAAAYRKFSKAMQQLLDKKKIHPSGMPLGSYKFKYENSLEDLTDNFEAYTSYLDDKPEAEIDRELEKFKLFARSTVFFVYTEKGPTDEEGDVEEKDDAKEETEGKPDNRDAEALDEFWESGDMQEIIHKAGGQVPDKSEIEAIKTLEGYWFKHVKANVNPRTVRVGVDTYIGKNAVIGPDCMIGSECYVGDGALIKERTKIGDDCQVYSNAEIDSSTLGQFCSIAMGSVIRRAQLADSVSIGKRSRIIDSTLGDSTKVGDDCKIGDCTISSSVEILNEVTLTESAIAEEVRIGASCKFSYGIQLHAGASILQTDWFMSIGPIGSRRDFFTVVEGLESKELRFYVGCANRGRSLQSFVDDVTAEHGEGNSSYIAYMTIIHAIEKMRRLHWKSRGHKITKIKVPKVKIMENTDDDA